MLMLLMLLLLLPMLLLMLLVLLLLLLLDMRLDLLGCEADLLEELFRVGLLSSEKPACENKAV